jgi:hypothetical protein
MDQIKGALTNRIGPFPGYVWAGIVIGGLFLVSKLRGGGLSGSNAGVSAPSPNPSSSQPGAQGLPGLQGPPGPAGTSGGLPHVDPNPKSRALQTDVGWWDPATNQVWTSGQGWHPRGGAGGGDDGVGGATRGRSIGSRSSNLMWHGHPAIKRNVKVTQTVRGLGGPAGHVAHVHAVAGQTGVHPARLLALNPHYSGVIRIH